MPKVSIVIPTYNRPELLPIAIRSVLAQTYQDYEILVVDDGLKIRAESIIAEINDPRIRYLKNENGLGGGATRNRGISEAQGEYVAFLDDDDEWLPGKLEAQVTSLDSRGPTVGFSITAVTNVFDDHELDTWTENGETDYSEIALMRFKGFLTSALMVRRMVFSEVGSFDPSFPSHQEVDLLIRITRKYKGYGINTPLVRMNMRAHEHIGGNFDRRIKGREMILEKFKDVYAQYPKKLALHYFWLALWYRDAGRMSDAKIYFRKACYLSPKPLYLAHLLREYLRV